MILEEIRKKRKSRMRTFCEIQTWINETSQSENTEMLTAEDYVKLSDIEKVLEDVRCESCNFKETCGIYAFVGKTYVPFSCSQFERKQ